MTMPRVFVTQEQPGKNILPAKKFGDIKILMPCNFQAGFSAGQVAQELMYKLSDYKETDFLLLIGDPVIIGITVAVAAHWANGKVGMLKWDRQSNDYYPVKINLYQRKEKENEKEDDFK
jgi:hypothetical protein